MMSRFYKIHIVPITLKQRNEIFMINPSMNTFDSFMIEICARLPELFYQAFKLVYKDSTGDVITIFNWLDFGIFFQQTIESVYIWKCDSIIDGAFRTLWSMPMPTAKTLSTYEQLTTQPAYQLAQSSHYNLLHDMKCSGTSQVNEVMGTNKRASSSASGQDVKQTTTTTDQQQMQNDVPTTNILDLFTPQNLNLDSNPYPDLNFTTNPIMNMKTDFCQESKQSLAKEEDMAESQTIVNASEQKSAVQAPEKPSMDMIKALEKVQVHTEDFIPLKTKKKKKGKDAKSILQEKSSPQPTYEHWSQPTFIPEWIAAVNDLSTYTYDMSMNQIQCSQTLDTEQKLPSPTEEQDSLSVECSALTTNFSAKDESSVALVEPKIVPYSTNVAVNDSQVDNICDSMKLIDIECAENNYDAECTQKVDSPSIEEEGQAVSPTWSVIETGELAESLGALSPPSHGAIPKSSGNTTANKGRKISKRTLPQIPTFDNKPEYFDSLSDPDFRASEALNAMIAMGFNNDDGQLSELLKNVNGNISCALDLLQY